MTQQQLETIEEFAEVMRIEGYQPLAGRIIGMFYVSDQKYFTFDEIVETLGYTKGSVSKALKYVQEIGVVAFEMKKDIKRRRYFYLNVTNSIAHYQNLIQTFKRQIELHQRCLGYRNGENEELDGFLKNMAEMNAKVHKVLEAELKQRFDVP